MNQRLEIINTARTYVGTPFVHQGRTATGLDCVGLVVRVAHDLELSKDDFKRYDRTPDGKTFQVQLAKYLNRRMQNKPRPGDIISFSLPDYPCHIAIYTNASTIIHALASKGQVVEHRLSRDWYKKIRGVYHYKGVLEWLN